MIELGRAAVLVKMPATVEVPLVPEMSVSTLLPTVTPCSVARSSESRSVPGFRAASEPLVKSIGTALARAAGSTAAANPLSSLTLTPRGSASG